MVQRRPEHELGVRFVRGSVTAVRESTADRRVDSGQGELADVVGGRCIREEDVLQMLSLKPCSLLGLE